MQEYRGRGTGALGDSSQESSSEENFVRIFKTLNINSKNTSSIFLEFGREAKFKYFKRVKIFHNNLSKMKITSYDSLSELFPCKNLPPEIPTP